nr:2393_t:CDS:2 [Entrophospora candida]
MTIHVVKINLALTQLSQISHVKFKKESGIPAIHNIVRIQNILTNPNDHSLDDLLRIDKSELNGASD